MFISYFSGAMLSEVLPKGGVAIKGAGGSIEVVGFEPFAHTMTFFILPLGYWYKQQDKAQRKA